MRFKSLASLLQFQFGRVLGVPLRNTENGWSIWIEIDTSDPASVCSKSVNGASALGALVLHVTPKGMMSGVFRSSGDL